MVAKAKKTAKGKKTTKAKKTASKPPMTIIRSNSYKQILVDAVFASESEPMLRLAVGTACPSESGSEEPDLCIEAELLITPVAGKAIKKNISDWLELVEKKKKKG